MPPLTQSEMNTLFNSPSIAKLGCLDDDGHPYVVPVWFTHADGGFYVIPRERSAWARYLQRDSRVALCIDDAQSRRVLVKGQAQLIEEPNINGRWVTIAREMALRYMGERGPGYLAQTLNEPRWLFFIRPERLTTWTGGWAKRYKHSDW